MNCADFSRKYEEKRQTELNERTDRRQRHRRNERKSEKIVKRNEEANKWMFRQCDSGTKLTIYEFSKCERI